MNRQERYPDTVAFHYFNANPKNKVTTGDCSIRALARAGGKDWDTVLDELVVIAHKKKSVPNDQKILEEWMYNNGFFKRNQPRKEDNTKYTGIEFCKYLDDNPVVGGYEIESVVAMIGAHHIVAIVQDTDCRFKINDTWDSSYRCIGKWYYRPRRY